MVARMPIARRLRVSPQDSRWANRIRERLLGCDRPVAILAPPEVGIEYAVAGLNSLQRPLVWVEFDDRDHDDPVSQGAKLTEAVERALGAAILGYGLTLPQVLMRVTQSHMLLGPFTICISGVRATHQVEGQLVSLAAMGSFVILHWRSRERWLSAERSSAVLEIGLDELLLTRGEVEELLEFDEGADWGVGAEARQPLLGVLKQCLDSRDLGLLLVPRSGGADLLTLDGEESLGISSLAEALVFRGRAIDAFELLARHGSPIPDELVGAAGRDYFEKGLHRRLWGAMADIPRRDRHASETLMRWCFAAATAVNEHAGMREEVRQYLECHDAPELRALFAAAFPGADSLSEAVRAYEALQSPTTLRIRAFAENLYGSGTDSVRLLQKALRMSERLGDHSMVIASATDLADYWSRAGSYREAITWSQWAVDWYWRSGCRDELRRLVASSVLTFNRLLVGDDPGDEDLDSEEFGLSLAGIPTSEVVLSSGAEMAFVAGDLQEAERLLRVLVDKVQFGQFGGAAVDLVHVLTQLGRSDEAVELGRRALAMSRQTDRPTRTLGKLAYGLSLVERESREAMKHLDEAVSEFGDVAEAPRLAQAAIALALCQIREQDIAGAGASLRRGERGLRELGCTGWTLLGGFAPELRVLREMFGQNVSELELTFLGAASVRLRGERVELGRRQCEVLAVLALNPRGMSAESLGLRVYGDTALRTTMKAMVSRLRQNVPIANKPYRIAADCWADFLQVEALAKVGRYREAASLYRGPLLPGSDAPAVVEARDHLEELVRSSVLRSGDVQAMLKLAEVLGDDMELLEAVLERLSPVDIRVPIVRAKRNQVARDWER